MYSHSLYLELLASTGIVGSFVFLGLLFVKEIVFLIQNSSDKCDMNIRKVISCRLVLVFIISILIGGIAVVYLYDLYFYIMISLILSHRKIILLEN